MQYEYIFYTTDESFDFGDFPSESRGCSASHFHSRTCDQREYHGFSIDIDKENNIDISSLKWLGDYSETQITTLQGLKEFIKTHLNEVEEIDDSLNIYYQYTNIELFEELIELIDDNLQVIAA